MSLLILNGRSIAYDQLAKGTWTASAPSLTEYENSTLRFCQHWLSGQDTFVVRTSGSTGRPKPISLSRQQMCASAHLTGKRLGLRHGDKALVCLSTEHIAGMMMLVRGFELGLKLTVITAARNPLAGFTEQTHFQFTALAPLQIQEIIKATPNKVAILNRMRAILLGGAAVADSLQAELQALTVPIYHTFGMTETASHIALRCLNGAQASDYFEPLDGVELGIDWRGCLTICSAVSGHETLHSNDRVELRADGCFRWLGRIDNVINSGGVKIQAEQVEKALATLFQSLHGGGLAERRFMIGPLPDPQFGQVVVAVIEGEPISSDIQIQIRKELLERSLLKRYEVPRCFYFMSRLLETPTGKIDRRANLQQLQA